MSGRVLLAGSGEFTPAMAEVDYAILGLFDRPARVAIVPTAAGREATPESWVASGMRHFTALGAEPFPLRVLDRTGADDPASAAQVAGADWIYFSGGDPGYVTETLAGSLVWQAVLARHRAGAIVAGSSAGAMMLGGETIVPVKRDPASGLPRDAVIRPGLGLVPGVFVFPHFDVIPEATIARWHKLWPAGLRLLALDEDTAIVSGDDGWTVHGPGRAIVLREPGARETFHAGATIPLSLIALP